MVMVPTSSSSIQSSEASSRGREKDFFSVSFFSAPWSWCPHHHQASSRQRRRQGAEKRISFLFLSSRLHGHGAHIIIKHPVVRGVVKGQRKGFLFCFFLLGSMVMVPTSSSSIQSSEASSRGREKDFFSVS